MGTFRPLVFRRVIGASKGGSLATSASLVGRRVRCKRRRGAHGVECRRSRHSEGDLVRGGDSNCTARGCRERGCHGNYGKQARRQYGRFHHTRNAQAFREVPPFAVLQGVFHCGGNTICRRACYRGRTQG